MMISRASVDSTNALARRLVLSGLLPLPELVSSMKDGYGAAASVGYRCETAGSQHIDQQDAVGGVRGAQDDAENAYPGVSVVAADTQTAGHGRLGRHWVDHPGRSFTVSFLVALPSDLVRDPHINGWLSVVAGLSCMDAIRGMIRDSGITDGDVPGSFKVKWPNDVMCDGRKLGGILIELVSPHSDRPDAPLGVIIGIGMNLSIPADDLPTEQSTSLQLKLGDRDPDVVRDDLAARIVVALQRRLGLLLVHRSDAVTALMQEMTVDCWTLGRRVVARLAEGGRIEGKAVAVCTDASLQIRDDDGIMHTVHTADVGVLGYMG